MTHADRDRSERTCIVKGCDQPDVHAFVKWTEHGIVHLYEADDPQTPASDATETPADTRAWVDTAEAKVARVEALHVKDGDFCTEDGFGWPCRTRRAGR